jgi:hypothetical protein
MRRTPVTETVLGPRLGQVAGGGLTQWASRDSIYLWHGSPRAIASLLMLEALGKLSPVKATTLGGAFHLAFKKDVADPGWRDRLRHSLPSSGLQGVGRWISRTLQSTPQARRGSGSWFDLAASSSSPRGSQGGSTLAPPGLDQAPISPVSNSNLLPASTLCMCRTKDHPKRFSTQ